MHVFFVTLLQVLFNSSSYFGFFRSDGRDVSRGRIVVLSSNLNFLSLLGLILRAEDMVCVLLSRLEWLLVSLFIYTSVNERRVAQLMSQVDGLIKGSLNVLL
jgi:hypothetical protein